jgi:hypothetical protein
MLRPVPLTRVACFSALLFAVACHRDAPPDDSAPPAASHGSRGEHARHDKAPPADARSAAPSAPHGKLPPDGKYERVQVEGVTVPIIEVMDHGAVVLVDTDGKKPRTWEEQFKRKRPDVPAGSFDVHKTDANKNGSFDDDPIDKEGLWTIDEKGNITKH